MHFKIIPSILMSLLCACSAAQEASEILLFDLIENDSTIQISNPINISANPGYDNQPAFAHDGTTILFASEREGQTDIAQYNLQGGFRTWITDTPDSEYSPAPYPGKKKFFSCVRLNLDDTQYLYKYGYKNREPEVIVPGIRVGYYLWFDQKTLITFVIGETETLEVSNFKYKIRYPIEKNIGRALQKIPGTVPELGGRLSYISLEHGSPEIYAIDPKNSEKKYLADALAGSQDLVWTPNGNLLMGNMEGIFHLKPGTTDQWVKVDIESDSALKDFSRMAVSPDGRRIAVVVRE